MNPAQGDRQIKSASKIRTNREKIVFEIQPILLYNCKYAADGKKRSIPHENFKI